MAKRDTGRERGGVACHSQRSKPARWLEEKHGGKGEAAAMRRNTTAEARQARSGRQVEANSEWAQQSRYEGGSDARPRR